MIPIIIFTYMFQCINQKPVQSESLIEKADTEKVKKRNSLDRKKNRSQPAAEREGFFSLTSQKKVK